MLNAVRFKNTKSNLFSPYSLLYKPILFNSILFYSILIYTILLSSILLYSTQFYPILLNYVQFYSILWFSFVSPSFLFCLLFLYLLSFPHLLPPLSRHHSLWTLGFPYSVDAYYEHLPSVQTKYSGVH